MIRFCIKSYFFKYTLIFSIFITMLLTVLSFPQSVEAANPEKDINGYITSCKILNNQNIDEEGLNCLVINLKKLNNASKEIGLANSLLDTKFSLYCHFLNHKLGYDAVSNANDVVEFLHNPLNSCSSGYLHGVLEKAATFITWPKLLGLISSNCNKVSSPLDREYFDSCWHGSGHAAFLLTQGDESKAFKLCNLITSSISSNFCSSGVSMEEMLLGFNSVPKNAISCSLLSLKVRLGCLTYPVRNTNLLQALKDKPCRNYLGDELSICEIGLINRYIVTENFNYKLLISICSINGSLNAVDNYCIHHLEQQALVNTGDYRVLNLIHGFSKSGNLDLPSKEEVDSGSDKYIYMLFADA